MAAVARHVLGIVQGTTASNVVSLKGDGRELRAEAHLTCSSTLTFQIDDSLEITFDGVARLPVRIAGDMLPPRVVAFVVAAERTGWLYRNRSRPV